MKRLPRWSQSIVRPSGVNVPMTSPMIFWENSSGRMLMYEKRILLRSEPSRVRRTAIR